MAPVGKEPTQQVLWSIEMQSSWKPIGSAMVLGRVGEYGRGAAAVAGSAVASVRTINRDCRLMRLFLLHVGLRVTRLAAVQPLAALLRLISVEMITAINSAAPLNTSLTYVATPASC